MTSNTAASNKPKTKGTVSPSTTTTSCNKSTNPKKSPKPKKSQSSPQQAKKKTPKLATNPPLECSKEDFEALLGDANGLSNYEEAATELLDCARYGASVSVLCISYVLLSLFMHCNSFSHCDISISHKYITIHNYTKRR